MKRYSAYLFDFDGTLFDTQESLRYVFKTCLQAVGKDCTSEESDYFMHLSIVQIAEIKGIPKEQLPRLGQALMRVIDEPQVIAANRPFPETPALFAKLRSEKVPFAIVSGNSALHIGKVLSYCGLQGNEVLMGNDKYKNPKPNPEPLLLALKEMGIEPSSSVCYVGDSEQDVVAAKAAHVDPILVDRSNFYPDYQGVKITSLSTLFE